jgi:hypothetical protein
MWRWAGYLALGQRRRQRAQSRREDLKRNCHAVGVRCSLATPAEHE